MTDDLARQLADAMYDYPPRTAHYADVWAEREAEAARAIAAGWRPLAKARPGEEWHEDDGPVIWWRWEDGAWLGEPPWIGTPLCDDWPGYHTHWTPMVPLPAPPQQPE